MDQAHDFEKKEQRFNLVLSKDGNQKSVCVGNAPLLWAAVARSSRYRAVLDFTVHVSK